MTGLSELCDSSKDNELTPEWRERVAAMRQALITRDSDARRWRELWSTASEYADAQRARVRELEFRISNPNALEDTIPIRPIFPPLPQ